MNRVVRRIRTGDSAVPEYRRMRVALWPDAAGENESETSEILADGENWAVFVALESSGAAVGFLEVRLREYAEGAERSPIPYLEGWYTDPEHRAQGIGRALVEAAERWAVSEGFREIASDTEIANRTSIAAHTALGFTEVERQVCFVKKLAGNQA